MGPVERAWLAQRRELEPRRLARAGRGVDMVMELWGACTRRQGRSRRDRDRHKRGVWRLCGKGGGAGGAAARQR